MNEPRYTRGALPYNQEMDDHHQIVRETTLEYLRDKTNRAERKAIIKEALHEWLQEKFAEFGWQSLRTLAALAFVAVVYMWLISQGWRK